MRALLVVAATLVAAAAVAHGPTVRLSYTRLAPETLTILEGQTVHFRNANSAAAACTVVAEDESFRSPTLARAEGWHHTFETAGDFAYFVEEYPSARGRVLVVAE